MGKVLVITSGKGGVGKTTCTANIGAGLALEGHSVLLLDGDIGLRNLDLVMGLENRIVFDVVDVVEKKCRSFRQAVIKDKRFANLHLLPAAQCRDKDAISTEQMKDLCAELRQEYDYVLVDCPAGIEMGFRNAIAGADEAIVVTNPEVSAIRDADRIVGLLEANDKANPRLVINRYKQSLAEQGQMLTVEDVREILGIGLLGIVPEDERIVSSSNQGRPAVMDDDSVAGQAYRQIVKRVIDPSLGPAEIVPEARGWFGRLRQLFAGRA